MTKLLSFTFLMLLAGHAFADDSKLSKDLGGLDSSGTARVIIQFQTPPGQADFDDVNAQGAKLVSGLAAVKGGLFSVPVKALQGLTNNPRIRYISLDRQVRGSLEFAEPTVNANIALQYGWGGDGVGV